MFKKISEVMRNTKLVFFIMKFLGAFNILKMCHMSPKRQLGIKSLPLFENSEDLLAPLFSALIISWTNFLWKKIFAKTGLEHLRTILLLKEHSTTHQEFFFLVFREGSLAEKKVSDMNPGEKNFFVYRNH